MRLQVRTTTLALSILFLVGCTSAEQGQIPGPSPEAPTSEPTVATLCANEVLPVVEGAWWEYEGESANGAFSRTTAILDVGSDAFQVELHVGEISSIETWRCSSDGLVQLQSDGGPFSAVLSGPDGSVTISTLSDEGVTLPPAFGVGDSWEQATLLSISSAEVSGQATLSYEFEVIQTETITVPAGTFQSLRVEVAGEIESPLSGTTFEYDSTEWFAPGVGLVRYEGHMADGGDLSAVTYELTGYSIP